LESDVNVVLIIETDVVMEMHLDQRISSECIDLILCWIIT